MGSFGPAEADGFEWFAVKNGLFGIFRLASICGLRKGCSPRSGYNTMLGHAPALSAVWTLELLNLEAGILGVFVFLKAAAD
jgi:hypothetical protein